MTSEKISKRFCNSEAFKLALTFLICSFASSAIIQSCGPLARSEAQNINRLFEARRWLNWAPTSLAKLNPEALWNYHQAHEFPRNLWNWDYTLSWLIEDNHPPVSQKIVIFNHLNEDDPPADATLKHPWLKPLLSRPLDRSIYSNWIKLLSQAGARAIILDNEFPQYTKTDQSLAQTIVQCANGQLTGQAIPVIFARTVNCRTQGNLVGQLVCSSNGLLDSLNKFEKDATAKHTGSVGVIEDEDQIVRRIATRIDTQFDTIESIPLKVLKETGQKNFQNIPDQVLIDFAGGANSELYPIRPLTYLLNPELRDSLKKVSGSAYNNDVSVRDAIVIIGDGITDVFNTATTNLGVNMMSGPELLANAIDTINRGSWLKTLSFSQTMAYLFCISILNAVIIFFSKSFQYKDARLRTKALTSWLSDFLVVCLIIVITLLVPALTFAYLNTVLPISALLIASILGAVVVTLVERDRLREESFKSQLASEQEKIALIEKHHQQELATEAARARMREAEQEHARRAEFSKRIEHDILGPASAINWTLLRLQKETLSPKVQERMQVLTRNSETLIRLVDQLTKMYNVRKPGEKARFTTILEATPGNEINQFVIHCVKAQEALAEQHGGSITAITPSERLTTDVDTAKLSRVINNLIRNAFLHNNRGTNVQVKISTADEFFKISVSDDGQGIAPERIQHIFSDGFTSAGQNDHAELADDETEHQGLGLGIVKSIVIELKGLISVESNPGKGTVFEITFPRTATASDSIALNASVTPASDIDSSATTNKKISA